MAAYSPTGPHRLMSFQRRALGPKDVAIKIDYAAICHSDIHTIHEDWGKIQFPQIVGHEIAGRVVAVGSSVSGFAVGARVGVGTMVNSCRICTECQAGHENYCLNGNIQTYASKDKDGTITQGGYSTFIVVDEDFVISVPDAIDLAETLRRKGRRHQQSRGRLLQASPHLRRRARHRSVQAQSQSFHPPSEA
jgi:uncharacterized zinc-type alcohol dehydrogenase-like protein